MNTQEKRTLVIRVNLTRGLTTLLTLALLLTLSGGILMMTRHAQAQEPQNVESPQADLGSAFTYQGYLEDGSSPVNSTCDFQFSLWDASSGGSQVGSTQTKTSLAVNDGFFTAPNLDFGTGSFTGSERHLQISVRCPAGSGSYTNLTGRAALAAAPYALSLMPGATVSSDATSGSVFKAVSSATSGDPAGLYGEANSATGAGVSGWNLSSSGGYAVYGNNTASTGTPYGVYGIAANGGSATSYGVYGKSNSSVGTGVGGIAPTNGVYGEASNSSGTTWGVYGKSNSTSGYGVYSSGNAHVEGDLTWKAKTSYVSVSTAAFIPESYGTSTYVDYQNEGYYLINEDSGSQWFVAPVQLPHGAVVTDLQVGWGDGSNVSATVYLRRRSMIDVTESGVTMAQVTSVGTFGSTHEGVWNDDTIDDATIDNAHYTYYLDVGMQDSAEDIKLYGVVIEYTITETY